MFYSNRLGAISDPQLQAALDRFGLGTLVSTSAISTGLFGQNLSVTSTQGEFVFRGSPHYAWQLPTERYFADFLRTNSTVPVPWPYLVEPESDIFPWPWGFAIMPKLPGLSLADVKIYATLSPRQRMSVATAMGDMLSRFHASTSHQCGRYDTDTREMCPFEDGYVGRVVERVRENIVLIETNGALDEDDGRWLDSLLDSAASLPEPDGYTVVHEDFNRNNLTFDIGDNEVTIEGVFDLMTCHAGDGFADLARQFCMFLDEAGGDELARAYVQAYLAECGSLSPTDVQRSLLYLVDERLLIWEYCHRPGHSCRDWGVTGNLRPWLGRYREAFESTLTGTEV